MRATDPETELLVLVSRVRTDEKRIFEALERRRVPYRAVDTRQFWGVAAPVRRPGGLVLNRDISFSRAVYAARTLEASGRTVVNSAAATEVCGDKWRTTTALVEAGLPTPRTALALTPEAALAACSANRQRRKV